MMKHCLLLTSIVLFSFFSLYVHAKNYVTAFYISPNGGDMNGDDKYVLEVVYDGVHKEGLKVTLAPPKYDDASSQLFTQDPNSGAIFSLVEVEGCTGEYALSTPGPANETYVGVFKYIHNGPVPKQKWNITRDGSIISEYSNNKFLSFDIPNKSPGLARKQDQNTIWSIRPYADQVFFIANLMDPSGTGVLTSRGNDGVVYADSLDLKRDNLPAYWYYDTNHTNVIRSALNGKVLSIKDPEKDTAEVVTVPYGDSPQAWLIDDNVGTIKFACRTLSKQHLNSFGTAAQATEDFGYDYQKFNIVLLSDISKNEVLDAIRQRVKNNALGGLCNRLSGPESMCCAADYNGILNEFPESVTSPYGSGGDGDDKGVETKVFVGSHEVKPCINGYGSEGYVISKKELVEGPPQGERCVWSDAVAAAA